MQALFRHFLLLGVILGLAGQSMALAATPCAMMQMEQVSAKIAPLAGMSDCAMGQHKTDKGSAPCKDMTPGCLAMAGCAALVAVDSLTLTSQAPLLVASLDHWSTTSVLTGRNVAPEPDPPSLVG